VLFFLGILLSVGAMDSAGILRSLAEILDKNIPNDAIVAGQSSVWTLREALFLTRIMDSLSSLS
jgi:Na+/H+ antiporter NhaD/arsenite permease-like protein